MTVVWSPKALHDVQIIAAYVEQRHPSGAANVVLRIEMTASLIGRHPGAGRTLARRPQVRMLPVGKYPYQVYYTTIQDRSIILHVRHAARRQPKASDTIGHKI